jgi:hypothetical protein
MTGIYDMQRNDSPSVDKLFIENGSVVLTSALVMRSCHDQDRFFWHFWETEVWGQRLGAHEDCPVNLLGMTDSSASANIAPVEYPTIMTSPDAGRCALPSCETQLAARSITSTAGMLLSERRLKKVNPPACAKGPRGAIIRA